MRFIFPALPPEQLSSLRRLASRANKGYLSQDHHEPLIRAGLVEYLAGHLNVTMLGRARLAIEVTRCNWRAAAAI